MSPHQSKAMLYSGRGDPVPAFPQFKTVITRYNEPWDEGIGAVISGTIGQSWRWFHLLNQSSSAEVPYFMPQTLLIPAAHWICFGSWRTLWHCLSLASLSIAGTSFLGLNESSHELIHTALRSFSITSAAKFPGEVVLNNTFECAFASCKADEGDCKMKDLNSSYLVDGHVQLNVLHESAMKLCEGVEAEIDADIAGPGVVISYIFQAAIAVYVWVFLAIPSAKAASKDLPSILARVSHLVWGPNHEPVKHLFPTLGFKILFRTCRSPTLRRVWVNLVHATSTFLVEFHEAQCFFVVSIEIALLYVNSRPLPSGANSMETLYMFRDLIELVGSIGAWSVILSYISLYRARLNSVYYTVLSTIALVLATITVATNPIPSAETTPSMATILFITSEGIFIVFLSFSLLSLGDLQKKVGADEWGVGQVIAVLVWAPVFSKYLYLIIFGIEKGFFHRISRAFEVVKRPGETENDDEGGTVPGDEEDVAPSDEVDIALGDATGADTVPLLPVHRNTAAW
ncbi:hypothetical protein NCS52_00312700 [Fusarium sp. LHS14.1]|nr:hypothetical protein NCS52_00312700 [Fusarium sp. LHS14.1]